MKRRYMMIPSLLLTVVLIGCGMPKKANDAGAAAEESEVEFMLTDYSADIEENLRILSEEKDKMEAQVGDSYEAFLENGDAIDAWMLLGQQESEKLYQKMESGMRDCYRWIGNHYEQMDSADLEIAMSDCYIGINEMMQNYEDGWSELYRGLYEKYNQVIEDEIDRANRENVGGDADGTDFQKAVKAEHDWKDRYDAGCHEMVEIHSEAELIMLEDLYFVEEGLKSSNSDVEALLKTAEDERLEYEKNTDK